MLKLAITLTAFAAAAIPPSSPAFAEPAGAEKVGPDVPPEIPAAVYRARRDRLAKELGACVGVIKSHSGGEGKLDQDFYYLTGVEESGAMLMLAPREPIYKQVLSLRPRDPEAEIWEGHRESLSPELSEKYAVDRVRRIRGDVPSRFALSLKHARCYGTLRSALDKPDIEPDVLAKYLTSYGARTEQAWQAIHRLRAVHDTAEIQRMEKAIAITIEGHRAAARELVAGATERAVASRIEDAFFHHGATGLAFPSIVAAGPNGAILHWTERDRTVRKGDLVVVDIGASYGHYAADITRTYPASGTFSAEQKKIYEIVLDVQNKVIAAVRPGISLDRLDVIAREAIQDAGYQFPHSIGHFVGLDVHDVGDPVTPLEPGMVITVEPGIYLQDEFGVRIEDEVLVTPRGRRLLTDSLPRTVSAVEAFIKEARAK